MRRVTGNYEQLGSLSSFIPFPLPPQDPPLTLSSELVELHGQAMLSLGKLNEMAHRMPDPQRFIKSYVIKEALLSSAIENIHTTIVDIFTQPLTESSPTKDATLVLNYIAAANNAVTMLGQENVPLSNRVLLAAHACLMTGDAANTSGYRTHAVRVGNLVPPPAPRIAQLMHELEHFINTDTTLPPLMRAGLAHVQFETIHPFPDGNGRVGRLLIVLMLIDSQLLSAPLLYPSYFFKKYRMEYYHQLDRVRTEGDFEGWLRYFLTAINASCNDAYQRAQKIESLEQRLRAAVAAAPQFAKVRESAQQALTILFQSPVISINELATRLDKSYNAAQTLIERYSELGIIATDSDRKRNRLYHFTEYIRFLEEE